MKTESEIQAEILRYLRSLFPACWVIKAEVCNERGVPDILVCYQGLFVAFEVKTETGRTSIPQQVQIKRIQKAGGIAAVVRSVEQVQEILDELGPRSSRG